MDLPGVQDLLGALQQAGNLLYQLLMVPKNRMPETALKKKDRDSGRE